MKNSLLRRIAFNLWYLLRKPPWDTGISPPELLAFLDAHPPGRALDLGCGTGTNVLTLARRGWQVLGVDFAAPAIAAAQRKLRAAQQRAAGLQAELRVGDVTQGEKLGGPYDLVLDMGCLHSLSAPGRAATIRNLPGLLVPGGSYLLYAFINDVNAQGMGLGPDDLQALQAGLRLAQRTDGSERGLRRSAWLTFIKP